MKKFLLTKRIYSSYQLTRFFGVFSLLFMLSIASFGQNGDLYVSIQGPTAAYPGETITYTIIYANNGTAIASDVNLEFTLPNYVSNVEASNNGAISGNSITWNISSLGSGLKQFFVTLTVGTPGTGSNQDPYSYYMPDCGTYSLESSATIEALVPYL